MPNLCWCGHATSNFIHDCAVCSLTARGITGLSQQNIPQTGDLAEMKAILRPGRGLTHEQRLMMLAEAETIDSELPRALRSRRGQPPYFSEAAAEQWRQYGRILNLHGITSNGGLPLPGGSILKVGADSKISIDDITLPGPLPMRDIALWMSNPARVGSVVNWKHFLFAMSCCLRDCHPETIDNWAEWYRHNAWHGVEPHMMGISDNFSVRHLMHPFLRFLTLLERDKLGGDAPLRELIDGNIELIEEQGGRAAETWLEILEDRQAAIVTLLGHFITPKLVVVNERFCLLALVDGKPTPIPVMVEPRVWRLLMAWTFEPPGTEHSEKLNDLFWCWNSEDEFWVPTSSQRNSVLFLKKTVETLGEHSSMEPVRVDSTKLGLRVKGASGLHYVLLATADPKKFLVNAIPHESMFEDAIERGVQICIDSQAGHDIPTGDVAASYLLALHNDLESQTGIITLHHLLDLLSKHKGWQKRRVEAPCWWDHLVDDYVHGVPDDEELLMDEDEIEEDEYYEEDYDWDNIDFEREEVVEHNREITRNVLEENLRELDESEEHLRQAIERLFERFGGDLQALEEAR